MLANVCAFLAEITELFCIYGHWRSAHLRQYQTAKGPPVEGHIPVARSRVNKGPYRKHKANNNPHMSLTLALWVVNYKVITHIKVEPYHVEIILVGRGELKPYNDSGYISEIAN